MVPSGLAQRCNLLYEVRLTRLCMTTNGYQKKGSRNSAFLLKASRPFHLQIKGAFNMSRWSAMFYCYANWINRSGSNKTEGLTNADSDSSAVSVGLPGFKWDSNEASSLEEFLHLNIENPLPFNEEVPASTFFRDVHAQNPELGNILVTRGPQNNPPIPAPIVITPPTRVIIPLPPGNRPLPCPPKLGGPFGWVDETPRFPQPLYRSRSGSRYPKKVENRKNDCWTNDASGARQGFNFRSP